MTNAGTSPGLPTRREIRPPIWIGSWFFLVAIPLLFVLSAVERTVGYLDFLRENEVREILFKEMTAFKERCLVENFIREKTLALLSKMGVPGPSDRKGNPGIPCAPDPIDASFLRELKAGLWKELGVPPLLLVGTNADSRDLFLEFDSRIISPARISRRALQVVLLALTRQLDRSPFLRDGHLERLKKAWEGRRESLDGAAAGFAKGLFGEYSVPPYPQFVVDARFGNLFGGGKVFFYWHPIPVGPEPDSPLRGAILAVFHPRCVRLSKLLKFALANRRQEVGRKRLMGSRSRVIQSFVPRFVERDGRFVFQDPLPGDITAQRFAGGFQMFEKFDRPPLASGVYRTPLAQVSVPRRFAKHPVGRLLPGLRIGISLALMVSGMLLVRFLLAGLTLPLRVRPKLLLAAILPLIIPLTGLWLGLVASVHFDHRFEDRKLLTGLSDRLAGIENDLLGSENALQSSMWNWQGTLSPLVSDEGRVAGFLDDITRRGLVQGTLFLRYDGFTFGTGVLSGLAKSEKLPTQRAQGRRGEVFSDDAITLLSSMAIIQLVYSRNYDLSWAENVREAEAFFARLGSRRKWSPVLRSLADFSDIRTLERARDLLTMEGRLSTNRLPMLGAFRIGYLTLRDPNRTGQDGMGVLAVLFPHELLAEDRLLSLYRSGTRPGLSGEPLDRHDVSVSVFRIDPENAVLLPFAPFTATEPELVDLARQAVTTRRDGTAIRTIGSSRHHQAWRRISGLPLLAVAVARPAAGSAGDAFSRASFPILVGYSLLILVLLAETLAAFFLNPISSLQQGFALVGAGDFKARVSIPSGDEFGELGEAFNDMSRGLLEKERMERFVPSDLLAEVRTSAGGDSISVRKGEAVVLFSDIRSFTTLSEAHPAPDIVTLLNDYFTEMEPCIEANGGVINKFIGDAILAIFQPVPDTPHPVLRAGRAALAMRERLLRFNRKREETGSFTIETGIGISWGTVISGGVGSANGRLDFTAVGDPVQEASLLEAASKRGIHTRIILSAQAAGIAETEFVTVPLERSPRKSSLAETPPLRTPQASVSGDPFEIVRGKIHD